MPLGVMTLNTGIGPEWFLMYSTACIKSRTKLASTHFCPGSDFYKVAEAHWSAGNCLESEEPGGPNRLPVVDPPGLAPELAALFEGNVRWFTLPQTPEALATPWPTKHRLCLHIGLTRAPCGLNIVRHLCDHRNVPAPITRFEIGL